jgi:hypothetical protein
MLTNRTLTVATALALLAGAAWAAQPTPTVPPFKCALDSRRNPVCDTQVDGTWIDHYVVGPGMVVSAITPVSNATVPAVYYISPPSPSTALYLTRPMGELPIANLTSNTLRDGSAWEPYRSNGILAASTSATAVRWVGIYNAGTTSFSVTVSWGSTPSQ